jgi:hypothetical protein
MPIRDICDSYATDKLAISILEHYHIVIQIFSDLQNSHGMKGMRNRKAA